jgi:hypothetical protein
MGGKDTVDSGIRVSAGVGLGALALSIIVAGFSRIPLGTLVLRAVVFGLLFAALTYLVIMLFRRFLPELFEESLELQAPESGRMVDIVLPGEESDLEASSVEQVDYLDQGDIGRAVGVLPNGESRAEPEVAVYSQVRNGTEAGNLEQEVREISNDGLIDGAAASGQGDAKRLRPIVTLDQLDVLPDLDGLSDAFSIAPDPDGSSEPAGFKPEALPVAGRTNGADPATLAKAVQTLLRRDQKGQ